MAAPSKKAVKRALKKREAFLRRQVQGKVLVSRVPDPSGVLTELGPLVAVVYEARKGRDRKSHHYEHVFDTAPVLCVASDGGLVIAGGDYRVTSRGIEG